MARTAFLPIAVLATAIMLAACTSTSVTPELVQKPPVAAKSITIGELKAAKDLWLGQVPYLRKGMLAKLRESNAFTNVSDGTKDGLVSESVVVTGAITHVDKGNKALRFLIGFGAGSTSVTGNFEIKDATGNTLAKFATKKAYGGGAGIGGVDFLDMDELTEKLGVETANVLIRWSKGEPLQPPENEE